METFIFITLSAFSRLVPHVPNMTAVGSTALFASSKLSLRKSIFITLSTLFISDAVIGFHPVMWATYGSFLIYVLLGRTLKKQAGWQQIGLVVFLSSFQFFIITNFAVWMNGSLYPKTLEGLLHCYFMALPFFRNTLMGDIGYTAVYFFAWNVYPLFSQKCRLGYQLLKGYIR